MKSIPEKEGLIGKGGGKDTNHRSAWSGVLLRWGDPAGEKKIYWCKHEATAQLTKKYSGSEPPIRGVSGIVK